MKIHSLSFDTWRAHHPDDHAAKWCRELYPWDVFAKLDYAPTAIDVPQQVAVGDQCFVATVTSFFQGANDRPNFLVHLKSESGSAMEQWRHRQWNEVFLLGHPLDTGFTDLERDAEGRAHFSIEARGMKVETLFGTRYPAAVIFAPPAPDGQTRDFICFEPMTGITNAVNLNHEGKYPHLQTVPPGARWTESFWIRASGI